MFEKSNKICSSKNIENDIDLINVIKDLGRDSPTLKLNYLNY